MERLEAAMAKARAERSAVAVASRAQKTTPNATPGSAAQMQPGLGDWSSLPSVDILPRQARRKRIGALLGPEFSTHYDILRSRVLRQMKEANWTRLAVTSPSTQCGKSTVILNLALSLARHGDLKIILMDFDLRHPSLASLLELKTCPDIVGLLRPGARFADYAVRFGRNLAICPNHTKVRNSAELLQGRSTEEALDRIEAEWTPDLILFDTPPMQGNDDNLGFFARVDCALIIAAAGASTLAQIDRCEQEVGNLTNILGTVLNKCRYSDNNTGFDETYY